MPGIVSPARRKIREELQWSNYTQNSSIEEDNPVPNLQLGERKLAVKHQKTENKESELKGNSYPGKNYSQKEENVTSAHGLEP